MAQQTAIQELIENLDHELKSRGMIVNWDMYLAKEKEQIIKARLTAPLLPTPDKEVYQVEAEDYYKQTYGTANGS